MNCSHCIYSPSHHPRHTPTLFPYTTLFRSADDCDFEPLDMSFHLADRQSIDEGLRRMLVHTVAGVDNRRAAFFAQKMRRSGGRIDRKSTRLNSSHGSISYAVFCLKKKKVGT